MVSLLPPLPGSGSRQLDRPLLMLACAAVAVGLVIAFVRGYAAANPPHTSDAIRRGSAKPVWTRAMWLQILGAFAFLALMLAVG
jgi:hypothetical protein